MVLSLGARVVGGVKVEEEKLLREGDGGDEIVEAAGRFGAELVDEDGESPVDKYGEGDGGVLKVVEMVGRNGAVEV